MTTSDFKISTRLSAGFGLIVLMAMVIGVVGSMNLAKTRDMSDHMVNQTFVKERLVTEWLNSTNLNGTRTMAIMTNADLSAEQSLAPKIKETTNRISEIQKQLDSLPKSAEEDTIYDEISRRRKNYLAARDEVFAMKKTGDEAATKKLTDKRLDSALTAYLTSIHKLVDLQSREITASTSGVANQFDHSQFTVKVLSFFVLLLSVGLTYWISRSITVPLAQAINVAQIVAGGDLTSRVKVFGRDEVSELLKALKIMTINLAKIVDEVHASSDTIAIEAHQIAASNQDLSARTEQQAISLEKTASTMAQITASARQNVGNVAEANEAATSASGIASKGGAVVAQVVVTMGAIHQSAKRIADIIGVIDGIAFQTNILALNAAVEAAHAGEQGRGFAVVASEVRVLAQRSAAAAKEIKVLINDSVKKINSGAKLVDQAGATSNEVVDSVARVTDIMSRITNAGTEQTLGIEQINDALTQLDEITQKNAALVEEAAASAEAMHEKTSGLSQMVKVFKLDKRTASRVPLHVNARLTLDDSSQIDAKTVDVSVSGISVITALNIKVGQECRVAFKLAVNGSEHDVSVVAMPVYSVKSANFGHMVGMRFAEDTSETVLAPLAKFVEKSVVLAFGE